MASSKLKGIVFVLCVALALSVLLFVYATTYTETPAETISVTNANMGTQETDVSTGTVSASNTNMGTQETDVSTGTVSVSCEALIDQTDVNTLTAAAYSSGHSAGYSSGYSDGYTAGWADGNASGYSAGYAAGLAAGGTYIQAAFTWDVPHPDKNQLVTFTSASISSSGITNYDWEFGDGDSLSSAGMPVVTHTYIANFTYTANLTVTSAVGSSMISEHIVVGYPTLYGAGYSAGYAAGLAAGAGGSYQASFIWQPGHPDLGVNVQFNSTSPDYNSITSIMWYFGDGDSSSGYVNQGVLTVNHIYTNNGTYPVKLDIGYATGQQSSINETVVVGYPTLYGAGYSIGYSVGYADGYAAGLAAGGPGAGPNFPFEAGEIAAAVLICVVLGIGIFILIRRR